MSGDTVHHRRCGMQAIDAQLPQSTRTTVRRIDEILFSRLSY